MVQVPEVLETVIFVPAVKASTPVLVIVGVVVPETEIPVPAATDVTPLFVMVLLALVPVIVIPVPCVSANMPVFVITGVVVGLVTDIPAPPETLVTVPDAPDVNNDIHVPGVPATRHFQRTIFDAGSVLILISFILHDLSTASEVGTLFAKLTACPSNICEVTAILYYPRLL
jgi:hypothetical protein